MRNNGIHYLPFCQPPLYVPQPLFLHSLHSYVCNAIVDYHVRTMESITLGNWSIWSALNVNIVGG